MALRRSENRGETWARKKQLTGGSAMNHTYARRPLGAQDGFLAFWADGHGRQPSESRLYFLDARENAVRQLPFEMANYGATPVVVMAGP